MELTISADHRIVYGADAADFLGTVRKRLERPGRAAALTLGGARRRARPHREHRPLHAHRDRRLDRRSRPGVHDRTGPATPERVDALLAQLDARGGDGAILLTHGHRDHAEAAPIIRERTGAPLAALGAGADLALADGETVGPLTTIATPGHASDHAAFLLGRVCFSGDLVLGSGSVMVSPEPGSMVAYLASLARLRALDLELIAPGHGPLVTDPAATLDRYIAHRLEREHQVLEALA